VSCQRPSHFVLQFLSHALKMLRQIDERHFSKCSVYVWFRWKASIRSYSRPITYYLAMQSRKRYALPNQKHSKHHCSTKDSPASAHNRCSRLLKSTASPIILHPVRTSRNFEHGAMVRVAKIIVVDQEKIRWSIPHSCHKTISTTIINTVQCSTISPVQFSNIAPIIPYLSYCPFV
jgi:hypothetical protein